MRRDRAGRAIGGRVRGGTRPADKLDRARPETHGIRIESQHKLGPALGDAAMEPVTETDVPSTLLGGGAGALSMPELMRVPLERHALNEGDAQAR